MPASCRALTRCRNSSGDPKREIGREVAGDVVAPGTLVRVLGGGHQLHVGVALPADVLDQLLGQFEVGETTTPGTQVHLVDADRLLVLLLQAAVVEPLFVVPGELALVDDRGGVRRSLAELGERVRLEAPHAVGPEHLVLVQRAGAHPLEEHRPDAGSGNQVHVGLIAVPVVEVTDQPDRLRVRGPDREPGAEDLAPLVVGEGHLVRAEPPEALGVVALVEPGHIPAGQSARGIECHPHSFVELVACVSAGSARVSGEAGHGGQRDGYPVRSVPHLVDHFVDRLVGLVRGQQRPRRVRVNGPPA